MRLVSAIHLYEKVGFRHDAEIKRTYGPRYVRANVAMRYPLPTKSPAAAEVAIIRSARGAVDLAAFAQLYRDYVADIGLDLTSQQFEAELGDLPGVYEPPEGEMFLAFDPDGTPTGCISLRPFDGRARCELKRLFVRPGTRGAGLGRRLLEAALDFATAAGYREALLETLPRLTRAIALYERFGFRRVPPYQDNVSPGAMYLGKALGRAA